MTTSMQMLDLPAVYEAAYRTRDMKNRVEEQDRGRSLQDVFNRNTNPQGQVDAAGIQKQAAAQGQGFDAAQALLQMDDATRARTKAKLEEFDTHAMGLADAYYENVKADPRTADANLQMSYDKLVVNNPELYAMKQAGQLPDKISHSMLIGMMGKHADFYTKMKEVEARDKETAAYHKGVLENAQARTKVMDKAVDKKGTTAKTVQENKDIAALASEYDTTEDEVRAVKKSYKTLAEENFPKALEEYRLEKPAGDQGGGRSAGQQTAFATLRKNPKNKDYTDEELWSAIRAKGIK